MPRDSSGNYSLPPGNPVATGTTITSQWANSTLSDVGSEITGSLSRSGLGGMLAPLQFVNGTDVEPAITFVQEPTLGFYRKAQAVMALAGLGEEQMSYDSNFSRLALITGANPNMTLFPSLGGGKPSYTLRDSTGFIRAAISFDLADGSVDITRYDDLGDAETILRLTDDGNVAVNGAAPTAANQLANKDYVDQSTGGINPNDYVLKTGSVMTGQLQGITPQAAPDLTRKDYVDGLVTGVGGSVADRVLRAGDIMTGQLGLPGGGIGSEAATVQEIQDAAVAYQLLSEKGANSGYAPLNGSGIVPPEYMAFFSLDFLGAWDASPGNLPPTPVGGGFYVISVTGTLNVVPADGSSSTPTPTIVDVGDYIVYSSTTTYWYQVTPNFAQEDARYVQLAGSTMTGDLDMDNGTSDSPQITFIDAVNNTDYYWDISGEFARMITHYRGGGAATPFRINIQSGQAEFSGPVTSNTAPAAANDLTRKDYVDTRVIRTGDTMTGQLSGIPPVSAENFCRKDYVDQAAFPSGTAMLFGQASAPVGWTVDATHTNKALRIVSATGGGSGGSVPFTTAFANYNAGATTLTGEQSGMPAHAHGTMFYDNQNLGGGNPGLGEGAFFSTFTTTTVGPYTAAQSHTHALTLAVQYVDFISCTKD